MAFVSIPSIHKSSQNLREIGSRTEQLSVL